MSRVETAGLDGSASQPLRITATLISGLASERIHLDGLLAWAVTQRDDIPPALRVSEIRPIEIPIQRSACGRVHLCSSSVGNVEARQHVWINRRFPIAEAQDMAEDRFRRINIAAGAQKSFRLPLETRHLEDDRLTWWAVGRGEKIADLLTIVGYLGKRRAVGRGAVSLWRIEGCTSWGDGFPVLRNGWPMRHLPDDYPGVREEADRRYALVNYPYWDRSREELCAVPSEAA